MARKIGTILLVFVCFYLGAHYWIRWRNSVTDDVSKVSKLVDCDANQVKGIKIVSKKEGVAKELAFRRVDTPQAGAPAAAQLAASEWKFQAPRSGEADASLLTRLSSLFCEIYDPIPVKDEEFALGDSPVERISFELEGAGEYTLGFGQTAEGRMVVTRLQSPDGAQRTFKMPPNLLELASLEPGKYLNLRVMRMNSDNINVASVFHGTRESFTLERQGDDWRVMRGGKDIGPGSAEARKFVNRLTTLRAIKADEEALSPANCERSQSRMSVEFTGVGDRKEALFFQYKSDGKSKGNVTVCNTARDALFTVHRDLIPYLETPVEKLMSGQ